MMPGEIVELQHQLLLLCPTNIWIAVKSNNLYDYNLYDYNLQLTINLNEYQHEVL
jgi:hypothetical protein